MVRVSPFVIAIASVVQALPAPEQVSSQKRAEAVANDYAAELKELTTALRHVAENPPTNNLAAVIQATPNKKAAMAGAAMLGTVGALIGGVVGAYMPENTTFTSASIMQGLMYEVGLINAAVSKMQDSQSMGLLTSLMPALGAALAQQSSSLTTPSPLSPPASVPASAGAVKPADTSVVPLPGGVMEMGMGAPKLNEGTTSGTSVAPLPGGVMQVGMEKPKGGDATPPKPADGAKSADSKPKADGMAEMGMAPPPAPGIPKPQLPTDAKAPPAPVPNTPATSASFTFPGLEKST